ncbi:energy-coupled thiamine transporter ThiT [Clostridium cadaveris]|uniref:energy-coupled thiamine transporter ThiT n=1 Tax=Clostridium cadaveris TaxID=1529 RepID=UPI0015B6AF70|nr:energy-coupled thiamine transporter ThiT [Clostridium cadaveris]NWK09985.1 energy-coupled thiamine transporter ThiT [Clostridium cadaveris]
MLESINKFVGQLGNLKESFFYVLARPSTVILLIAILVLCIVFAKVKKIKFSAKLIAQIGLAITLACVLQVLRVYRWPQGGSVTLGSMVPILFMGIVYGPSIGLLTGFIFGLLNLILDPFILTPVQMLLDYPLAYMSLGLVGFFKNNYIKGTVVALFGRFLCHFLSGVIFFGSYAIDAGMTPIPYSLLVNGVFISVEGLICIIILKMLPIKRLKSTLIKEV